MEKVLNTMLMAALVWIASANAEKPSRFEDVTDMAGVQAAQRGRGAVSGDYDRDGDLDLYVANAGESDVLYRNNGDGTFTDVTQEARLMGESASFRARFLDYDNDGDLDIYVARGGFTEGAPNALYRNNG